MNDAITLSRVGMREATHVTHLVARTLCSTGLSRWLVPSAVDRDRILLEYLRIWVEHAMFHGEVHMTGNRAGVAVWFPHTGFGLPEPVAYPQRLAAACGETASRFRSLDRVLRTQVPTTPHHRLAFVAVSPHRQRRGLGSALLEFHHRRLDDARLGAYTEVLGLEARDLFLRLGYRFNSAFVISGAPLYRMWRNPLVSCEVAASERAAMRNAGGGGQPREFPAAGRFRGSTTPELDAAEPARAKGSR